MTSKEPANSIALIDAIDQCIDALRRGDSIDDCLARYPEFAEELRPYLLTVSSASTVAPQRDEATRRMGRAHFEGAVRHHLATNQPPASRWTAIRDWWNVRTSRKARVYAVGLATMALFLALSTGAAFASTDALPDSPLYPVKRAAEHARLAITFSDESRAIYHLELIERRTLELAAVAELGDSERIQQLSRDVLKNIEFARVESGYTPSDVAAQTETSQEISTDASLSETETGTTTSAETAEGSQPNLDTAQAALDAGQQAYLEAERAAAAHAHAMLQIAHQLAPPEGRQYVVNVLSVAEQRYRHTHWPASLTLFAQGIVRISDDEMTLGGGLPLILARQALGNRAPGDGDFMTVGGYVQRDGALLVLRLHAFEPDGDVAENEIWLQAESLGSNGSLFFIPGFNVTPAPSAQWLQPLSGEGSWVYLKGTITDAGELLGEEIRELGGSPIQFPQP